jgi:hypothetical protein
MLTNIIDIGYYPFEKCHNLKNIVISKSAKISGSGFPRSIQVIYFEDLRAAQIRQRNAALTVLMLCASICVASCVAIVRMKELA